MTIKDKLFESKFSKNLMEATRKIINKWSSIHYKKLRNLIDKKEPTENKPFESVGTNSEKEIYAKAQKFWAIQETLEDLDKVFIFLNIDRNKITEYYPTIETQKDYFKYHIENYIIRINTLLDLTGKLGNLLYNTGIDDKKCNGYNFKEKLKKIKPNVADSMEDILSHAIEIKVRRHQKLHSGQLEIDELEDFAIWEDVSNILKIDLNDSILKSRIDEKIDIMIDNLKIFATDLVEKINIFLEKSNDRI